MIQDSVIISYPDIRSHASMHLYMQNLKRERESEKKNISTEKGKKKIFLRKRKRKKDIKMTEKNVIMIFKKS